MPLKDAFNDTPNHLRFSPNITGVISLYKITKSDGLVSGSLSSPVAFLNLSAVLLQITSVAPVTIPLSLTNSFAIASPCSAFIIIALRKSSPFDRVKLEIRVSARPQASPYSRVRVLIESGKFNNVAKRSAVDNSLISASGVLCLSNLRLD